MKYFFLLFFIIFSFSTCKQEKKEDLNQREKPLILISKDFNHVFQNWLIASTKSDELMCFNMYPMIHKDSIEMMLKKADGIIISGGEDVHPALYGKCDELERCGKLDPFRDSLEQMMIEFAITNKVPLLGVCRGHQILNVTNKGTLIIDIPEDIGSLYLHRDNRKESHHMSTRTYHTVFTEKNTLLYEIVKADSGNIHSNHHQSVEFLAPGYRVSSYAKDHIIESIELRDTLKHPFVLGVQWHPEAMDVRDPFSGNIGRKFMQKVKQHHIR